MKAEKDWWCEQVGCRRGREEVKVVEQRLLHVLRGYVDISG